MKVEGWCRDKDKDQLRIKASTIIKTVIILKQTKALCEKTQPPDLVEWDRCIHAERVPMSGSPTNEMKPALLAQGGYLYGITLLG